MGAQLPSDKVCYRSVSVYNEQISSLYGVDVKNLNFLEFLIKRDYDVFYFQRFQLYKYENEQFQLCIHYAG